MLRSLARFMSVTGRKQVVVTGAGKDRLGIVKDISGIIMDYDGNIVDSRMSNLGGYFATMLLVDVPVNNLQLLKKEIVDSGDELGMHLDCNEVMTQGHPEHHHARYNAQIQVKGADHPGIIHEVSEYLSEQGVNIESIRTSTEPAPMGGTTLFKMLGRINIPELIDIKNLQNNIKKAESKIGVDIIIQTEEENENPAY